MCRKFILCIHVLFVLVLTICADPEARTITDIYPKLCLLFKLPKFCYPNALGTLAFPYQYPYAIPIIQVPGINPFPIGIQVQQSFPPIPNPTPAVQQPYTIPTVYTTSRPQPFQQPFPQPPQQPFQQPFQPLQPFPCPPTVVVCGSAGPLSPNFDPRQGKNPEKNIWIC